MQKLGIAKKKEEDATEEEVATTLLMLPFAFPEFEEFHDFAVELEDEIIPQMEDEAQGPTVKGATSAPGETADIQLATFHPLFQWGGTNMDDPLNYEKRAPFPTINLYSPKMDRKVIS